MDEQSRYDRLKAHFTNADESADPSTKQPPPTPSFARELHALQAHALQPDEDIASLEIPTLAEFLPVRCGRFLLRRVIGEGGEGVVVEALQEDPQRVVALKLLAPGPLSRRRLRRFRAEADHLALVNHPLIAQIFDLGQFVAPWGRQPYIAMEFVDGEPLDAWVAQHAPPLERRIALVALVADAVDAAHRQGLVHRDLKPANILVTSAGTPKVLDFGLGRLVTQAPGATTIAGQEVIGTLRYMSPEQAAGLPVTPASDVFALAAVLFEAITGEPFRTSDQSSLAMTLAEIQQVDEADRACQRLAALRRRPHASRHDPRLTRDVAAVLRKALSREPRERYPTAGALAEDLRRLLDHTPVTARRSTLLYRAELAIRRHRRSAIITTLLVIALTGAIGYHLSVARQARDHASSMDAFRASVESHVFGTRSTPSDPTGLAPVDLLRIAERFVRDESISVAERVRILYVAASRLHRTPHHAKDSLSLAKRAEELAATAEVPIELREQCEYTALTARYFLSPSQADTAAMKELVARVERRDPRDPRLHWFRYGLCWQLWSKNERAAAWAALDRAEELLSFAPVAQRPLAERQYRVCRALWSLTEHPNDRAVAQAALRLLPPLDIINATGGKGSDPHLQLNELSAYIQAHIALDGLDQWTRASSGESSFESLLKRADQLQAQSFAPTETYLLERVLDAAGQAWKNGTYETAERAFRTVATLAATRHACDPIVAERAATGIAVCLRDHSPSDQARLSEAESLLRTTRTSQVERLGSDSVIVAQTNVTLSRVLLQRGVAPDEALSLANDALTVLRREVGERAAESIEALAVRGAALRQLGHHERAAQDLHVARRLHESLPRAEQWRSAIVSEYVASLAPDNPLPDRHVTFQEIDKVRHRPQTLRSVR